MKKKMVVKDLEDNLLFILPKHRENKYIDELFYSDYQTHCYIYLWESGASQQHTLPTPLFH